MSDCLNYETSWTMRHARNIYMDQGARCTSHMLRKKKVIHEKQPHICSTQPANLHHTQSSICKMKKTVVKTSTIVAYNLPVL